MVILENVTYREDLAKRSKIFPDMNDFGSDKGDYGSMLSVLELNSLIGCSQFRLGDSNYVIQLSQTQLKGEQGIRQFAEFGKVLADAIEKALPDMKDQEFTSFFKHYLSDFRSNGLCMPIYGRII